MENNLPVVANYFTKKSKPAKYIAGIDVAVKDSSIIILKSRKGGYIIGLNQYDKDAQRFYETFMQHYNSIPNYFQPRYGK